MTPQKDPNRKYKPWEYQEQLQSEYHDEVPTINGLAKMINEIQIGVIDWKFQTKRAKALVALFYLTGCRCTELVRTKKLRRFKIVKKPIIISGKKDHYDRIIKLKPVEIKRKSEQGIMRKHIKKGKVNGKKFLKIKTNNRKNKKRTKKDIMIPIEKERAIVKFVWNYVKNLEGKELLFDISQQRAIQIVYKSIGFNMHFLRHIRATHLVTKYDFNEHMLVKFMGWTDSRPAKHYLELRTKDIAEAFYKK